MRRLWLPVRAARRLGRGRCAPLARDAALPELRADCGTVVVEDEVVDHYDLELERGAAELARSLHDIVEENIEREAARLREALDGGHLLPEDF